VKTNRKLIIGASAIGFGVLVAGSCWATSKMAIWDSVRKMWPDPWFKITMIDLYAGFIAIAGIIAVREKSVAKTSLWVILLAGLGNIATFLYLILELRAVSPTKSFWSPKRESWKLF
jgi:hypothetical protein